MAQRCFLPGGDLVSFDTPCFQDAEVSPCCGLVNGWTCLANGLCYHPATKVLGRGTCTDRTWGAPNCPQFCTKNEFKGTGALDYSKFGPAAWQCSNNWAAEGGLMCCDISDVDLARHNRSCCSGTNAINLFRMGSKLGSATSITLTSSSSQASASESSSSISATSFSSSASLSATSPSNINSAPSNSSLGSSPSFSSATSSPTPNHFTTNGSKIAIAVSISVGAIILIVISFLIYRRRQRIRRKSETSNIDHTGKEFVDLKELPGQQGHELPGQQGKQGHELPGQQGQQGHELPGQQEHELPTDLRRELPE